MAHGELSAAQKKRVSAAVTAAEERTGLEFCVITGLRPHADARREAERAFDKLKLNDKPAVMIVVTPSQRTLEIVTADDLSQRLTNGACDEAVQVMTAAFVEGDITGGIERGIELLADSAGPRTDGKHGHPGTDLPNVIDLDEDDAR